MYNNRPIRIGGKVAFIDLTQGYEAVIDVEDASLVCGMLWHVHICKGGTYARTWARSEDGSRLGLLLHKAITGFSMTDHRDGDGLNNRRNNLRATDHTRNSQNSRMHKDNMSGFKGVSVTRSGRWRARISALGVQNTIGTFDSPEAAHQAYCRESIRLHGEFGRLT